MRKRAIKSKGLIRFHNTYLVMALCFVLSGYFLNLIVFTSLILVHELGHYLVARILKFNVMEIVIYPYGGITRLDDLINRNTNEELLVASSGVIMEYLFYLVIVYLYKESVIREYTFNLFRLYNSRIIFFNLLPIYPLDGGRIVNLLLNKIVNYNLSNKLTVFISSISVFGLVFLSIYSFNYSNIIIYMVLIGYIIEYKKNIKYLYNKFMLERYLYTFDFDDMKIINNKNKMYKDKKHLFFINNRYFKEKDFLFRIFLD